MEQNNNSIPENIADEGLVELAKRRQDEIEHKKIKFQKIMKLVKIFAVILIIAGGIGLFFLRHKQATTPPKFSVQEQTGNGANEPTWRLYKSDAVKVFIQNQSDTDVRESTTPSLKVEVIYDNVAKDLTKITEANLQQGYIFRVTPLNVGLRTIKNITQIKLDSFRLKCPSTAVFSGIADRVIDGIEGNSFEINNCDSDYVVTYIPKFGIYYEIVQMFKGDFGYRQKYKALTDHMITTFKFFPEGSTEPTGPFRTYINEEKRILFIHPNLDPDCCNTPVPPIDRVERVVVLGDRDTYIDANNFDGIGVYRVVIQSGGPDTSFDAFLAKQKQLLIEDYKVVRGIEPATQDIPVKVGKYDGVMLKGYSWRGNSLVYAQYEDARGQRVYRMIFSIKNVSGEIFDKKVEEILKSVEVF